MPGHTAGPGNPLATPFPASFVMAAAMRLFLVDDEPLALRGLEALVQQAADVEIVGTARDVETALAEARRLKPDLVILDVEMPGGSGLDVAAALDRESGTEIIILSAFDRYAASAFEVEALDYLLKPLRPERLWQALERARRRRVERAAHASLRAAESERETAVLHVPDRNGGVDVAIAAIVWIEAARDYALIRTRTRSHIFRVTMTDLDDRLPDDFLRVHRSALVNVAEVRRWGVPARGVSTLILSDGTEVAVGPTYLTAVRMALHALNDR